MWYGSYEVHTPEIPMPAIDNITPEQADLITQSFDTIWTVRRKLATTFYGRFFELAPDARRLFPGDMERQHLKLMGFDRSPRRRARQAGPPPVGG